MSYREIIAALRRGQLGVGPAGASLALCRACLERGIAAWCYEFGFPQILTHTVTVVEIDGVLRVHDAFFNLGYPLGFHDMLQSLRHGISVTGKRVGRDRKVYILDPACESGATMRWFEANADREIEPGGGVRRFELAWSPESLTAACPATEAASRALAEQGYPSDLQYLMLHPVSVFDGRGEHRDPATMPLVGGLDLRSPSVALRDLSREVEAERSRAGERAARVRQLESELAEATEAAAVLVAAGRDFAAEREAFLKQKVAQQAGRSALEGELAQTRSQLAAAIDLRAQKDSQIAQLRAEIEDAARQLELEGSRILALEVQQREWEAARQRLENLSQRNEALRQDLLAAEQRAVEITECVAPLCDEIAELRRVNLILAAEREAACLEKAFLERQMAKLPGARLRALWQRSARIWVPSFRAGSAKPE